MKKVGVVQARSRALISEWIWIPLEWNPDRVDKDEERYVKFLFYKWMEKLHFKTIAPHSLPLLSTLGLLKFIRWDYFWIRPKKRGEEIKSCKIGDLFWILEELKTRLRHTCWLHQDHPEIINNLQEGIDQALQTLDRERRQRRRGKSSGWSILIEKEEFEGGPGCEKFNRALDELNAVLDGELDRYDSVHESILFRQRELLAQLIRDQNLQHWLKLELIDNYVTEYIRDLVHYGHSLDYLYRWLLRSVMATIQETGPEMYLDRFERLPGICEGDKEYTVFLLVRYISPGLDLRSLSTQETKLHYGFPQRYTDYQGYEIIRRWHEEERNKPVKMSDSIWASVKVFAKDPIQAATIGSIMMRRYSNIITKLARSQEILKLHLCGNPIVATEEQKQIEPVSNPRSFDFGNYKNVKMFFENRDQWLEDSRIEGNQMDSSPEMAYEKATFEHIETVLDWILQATTGGYRGIRQSITIPAESVYVSLWTALERLFTEEVNYFEHLPYIVALNHAFIELYRFQWQLWYFYSWGQIELPKDITDQDFPPYSDFLDRLQQSFFKRDEFYQLTAAEETFIEYTLRRCTKLHPTTVMGEDGNLQSHGPQGNTRSTLLEEIEKLLKATKADLVIMRKVRNLLIHQESIKIDQSFLYLLIKHLAFYLSLSVDALIYRYGIRRYDSIKDLFKGIRATGNRMYRSIENSQLNSFLLLKPHKIPPIRWGKNKEKKKEEVAL